MPSPPSLGGAGLSEVAQSLRLPVRSVHLAVRRCRQRPSTDRWALDCKQSSFRHITRVLPSNDVSAFFRSRLYRHARVPSPFRVQVSR